MQSLTAQNLFCAIHIIAQNLFDVVIVHVNTTLIQITLETVYLDICMLTCHLAFTALCLLTHQF